jgi:serpin B
MPAPVPPARSPRNAAAFVLVALVVLATACIGTTPSGQTIRGEAPRRAPDDEFLPTTVGATNDFGIDLYRAVAANQGNVVTAPYATMTALGMARAGSAGTTRVQFDEVLHADATPNLDEGLNALEQRMATRSGEKSSANRRGRVSTSFDASVWGQRGTRFKAGYLDVLAADYDAPMWVVDFRSDAETSREAINEWGAEVTQDRITEVVPRGDVTAFTRFLPAAVSYLRAPWEIPFDRSATRPGPFVRLGGDTVDVQTMRVRAPSGLRTAATPAWEAVEIPYLGDQLSLLVIVPRSGTFDAFRNGLDANAIDRITADLEDGPIDLRLPQFQFTTSADLTGPLESIGLRDAFNRNADFSGITSDEVLSLSGMAYQGYFGIDEEGTDAETTATAPAPETTPAASRVTVDRPFLFAVRDGETGLIVLLGQVLDPG